MQQQDIEPTYLVNGGITGQEALEQARVAQLATRRRWPAVDSAVAAIKSLNCTTDTPTQARIA